MTLSPFILLSISLVVLILGWVLIIWMQLRSGKYGKKMAIYNSVGGLVLTCFTFWLLIGQQIISLYIVFIALIWIFLLAMPNNLRFRMGAMYWDYYEKGELKKYKILLANIKELDKESWFKDFGDNIIYSWAISMILYTEPFISILEQQDGIATFQQDEKLREHLINKIKEKHREEMTKFYNIKA